MIYIVAGSFREFKNFCRNHLNGITSDIVFLSPTIAGSARGIKIGKYDRVILTCGFFNDAEWYWNTFLYSLNDHNQPEFIACCGKLVSTTY